MAFQTNSAGDVVRVASTEMNVLANSPSTESTNRTVTTPAATGVSDIETLLSDSLTLSPVQPVESDAQQLSLIQNMSTQLIGDADC